MWCVFEVASWIHLGKDLHYVWFAPVSQGVNRSVFFAFIWITEAAIAYGSFFSSIAALAMSIMMLIFMPFALHAGRFQISDLRRLPEQLATLSVRDDVGEPWSIRLMV